ncbi:hypothetical protein MMC11_002457 [Xylographa trunciseda]|nr:hypothetical protein [Xylographa trunciseda]
MASNLELNEINNPCNVPVKIGDLTEEPKPNVERYVALNHVPSSIPVTDVPFDPDPPPDGSLRAWTQLLINFLINALTWGCVASFGVYQLYYTETLLLPPSQISWTGSVQIFLIFFFLRTRRGRRLCTTLAACGDSLAPDGDLHDEPGGDLLADIPGARPLHGYRNGVDVYACCGGRGDVFCAEEDNGAGSCSVRIWVWERRVSGHGAVSDAPDWLSMGCALRRLCLSFARHHQHTPTASSATPHLLRVGCVPRAIINTFAREVIGFSDLEAINLLLLITNAVGVPLRPLLPDHHIGPINTLIPSALFLGLMLYLWAAGDSRAGLYVFAVFYGFNTGATQRIFVGSLASLAKDLSKTGTRFGMVCSILAFATLAALGVNLGPTYITAAYLTTSNESVLVAQVAGHEAYQAYIDDTLTSIGHRV